MQQLALRSCQKEYYCQTHPADEARAMPYRTVTASPCRKDLAFQLYSLSVKGPLKTKPVQTDRQVHSDPFLSQSDRYSGMRTSRLLVLSSPFRAAFGPLSPLLTPPGLPPS